MMESLLAVEDVSLCYSVRNGVFNRFTHQALSNVSFDVFPCEVFGVLGTNGSGKSSLLKILAGIIEPDSGQVKIKDGKTRSLLSLGLGFNEQLTGRDNALISSMLNGISRSESKELLEEIKEFSELGDFFEQPVKTYSAGMRSRLGFTTGIKLSVDLLLIDETLSVGDSNFQKKAESAMLSKINSQQTVVFVSHSEHQIKRLCDRAIWLKNGEVAFQGCTPDVINYYNESKESAKS